MQINYINIYNFCKSLSTKLIYDKYEQLCIWYEQSRNWKRVDVTFKDNPQGFFSWYTDFFLCKCKAHCTKYMIVPLLANLHLMFLHTLWQPWTKCLSLHCRAGKASRLHVKPGLSAVCITYLLKHPQGQLRAEFPGTPLRGKPWEWCSTLQCAL